MEKIKRYSRREPRLDEALVEMHLPVVAMVRADAIRRARYPL